MFSQPFPFVSLYLNIILIDHIQQGFLLSQDFPGGSDSKASAYNAGDRVSIPGWGRCPGEGNGTPLQYSCLENPMDGGAWQATVPGVAKSWTQLSDFTSLPNENYLQMLYLAFDIEHTPPALISCEKKLCLGENYRRQLVNSK